ncbi:MAG: hypothetical protein KDE27_07545 [Planctomycetes bacterium]|nr:hypothetical protein [Planctomycetota bacterium]
MNRDAGAGIEVDFDDVALAAVDTAAWSELGNALAGTFGLPRLRGAGTLAAGSPNRIELQNAAPSTLAYLVFGFSTVGQPLLGGVLVPAPDFGLVLPTDAAGQAAMALPWPAGFPGVALWFQAWILDAGAVAGVAASNALGGTSS